MALINFLKFNSESGAIISDEEYWNVFFRKRMHGDCLHPLLDASCAAEWGMQVIYGFVGYPSVHTEAITSARAELQKLRRSSGGKPARVKDVARIAFDALKAAIRVRVDQKLKFYYGFTSEDLHRGFFMSNSEKIMILSDVIKEAAQKISELESTDTLLKSVLDAKAVIFGYDGEGITGYHLSAENAILGYVHEGFEAIGAGKYASGLMFGQDFKAKTLKMRQKGYSPGEGLLELIQSAVVAGDHFKEVGGNYNMMILNRSAETPAGTLREVFDDTARLCVEIVRVFRAELISRSIAVELLEDLVFKGKSFDSVENDLFGKCSNITALNFLLRNYKAEEVRELAALAGAGSPSGEPKRKSGKGGRK